MHNVSQKSSQECREFPLSLDFCIRRVDFQFDVAYADCICTLVARCIAMSNPSGATIIDALIDASAQLDV